MAVSIDSEVLWVITLCSLAVDASVMKVLDFSFIRVEVNRVRCGQIL